MKREEQAFIRIMTALNRSFLDLEYVYLLVRVQLIDTAILLTVGICFPQYFKAKFFPKVSTSATDELWFLTNFGSHAMP